MSEEAIQALRDSIINGLRMAGWSKSDAEDEADERIERLRQRQGGEA